MFGARARSWSPAVGQELVARRARAARDDAASRRRVALVLARRAATAAATAATSCTSGSSCCSSASPPRRRSSTRATCALAPGQTRAGRRLRRSPTSSRPPTLDAADQRPARADRPRRRAARARATASTVGTLHTERGYFPPSDADARPGRRASSTASRRARSACAPGLRRDVWTRDHARHRALQPRIDRGRQGLRQPPGSLPPSSATVLLAQALRGLAALATPTTRRRRRSASSSRRW